MTNAAETGEQSSSWAVFVVFLLLILRYRSLACLSRVFASHLSVFLLAPFPFALSNSQLSVFLGLFLYRRFEPLSLIAPHHKDILANTPVKQRQRSSVRANQVRSAQTVYCCFTCTKTPAVCSFPHRPTVIYHKHHFIIYRLEPRNCLKLGGFDGLGSLFPVPSPGRQLRRRAHSSVR